MSHRARAGLYPKPLTLNPEPLNLEPVSLVYSYDIFKSGLAISSAGAFL